MDHRPLLPKIAAPTLVIAGTHDPATPLEGNEYIRANIPGAKLAVLDAAHLANLEQPKAYADTVMEFLASKSNREQLENHPRKPHRPTTIAKPRHPLEGTDCQSGVGASMLTPTPRLRYTAGLDRPKSLNGSFCRLRTRLAPFRRAPYCATPADSTGRATSERNPESFRTMTGAA